MKSWMAMLLIVLALLVVCDCSRNKLGDLFRTFGEGDPGDDGFGGGDLTNGNGSFGVLSLEPGTIFESGAPEILALHPQEGALDVDVNTLVVLRFNESLNPDPAAFEKGVKIRRASDGAKVDGTYSLAPGSAGIVLVFEPTDALQENTEYEVVVTPEVKDAQGVEYDPGEGVDATVSNFFTGKDGAAVNFAILSLLTVPADGAMGVSDGASILVFFTEAVDTSDSNNGLGGTSDNLTVKEQGGKTVEGERSFEYGDRLLMFTPDAPYTGGKEVTAEIKSKLKNGAGNESLGQLFTTSFTVVSFPRVTGITFPKTLPLIALPGSLYQGRINKANQHAFEVEITVEGPGSAAKLTILFWDNKTNAVIVAKEGQILKGSYTFTVDLMPGQGTAISDGTITVGAYTRSQGVNSPVGPPLDLPDLRKDVVAPTLGSLGPPNLTGFVPPFYDLLTEVPNPGIHGRASESLSEVTVNADFFTTALPQVKAIKFFSMEYPAGSSIYSEEVTRGVLNLFITPPVVDFSTGGMVPPLLAGRGDPPITVTQIVLTDLVGNKTTYSSSLGGSLNFRGYFFSIPNGTGSDLEILCYDEATLQPLANVDIIVEDADLAAQWAAFTNAKGDALITTIEGTPVAGDRMILTAVKNGYQVTSLVWTYTLDDLWVSLPLTPEAQDDLEYPITVTIGNATGADLPDVFFGGSELRTGGDDTLVQSATPNPLSVTLNLKRDRLQFLEAIGVETSPLERYQWAWSNPFVHDTDGGVEAVLFRDPLMEPDPVQPVTFDSFGDPGARQARLAAALPGVSGTLPLGVDLAASDDGGLNRFDIPLPPSLFVNEVIGEPLASAAFDPPYELMIQPDLGEAQNDDMTPDETLLQAFLFFEMERIDDSASPPRIVRTRFAYDPAKLGIIEAVTLESDMADPPDLNLPDVQWENVLNPFFTGDPKIGVYRATLENTDLVARHWITIMSFEAAGTGADVSFAYPDLAAYGALPNLSGQNAYDDFSPAGAYPFLVEAYYIPSLGLSNHFFSLVEKNFETYWRSARVDVTKP